MSATGKVFLSDQFGFSCGTVTLDVQRSKVLLIRWQETGQYMLPKGKKDIGESMEQTAMRETYEETGIRVELLPVNIPTLATCPSSAENAKEPPKTITEPIAVTHRINSEGVLKPIIWFVGAADFTSVKEEGTQGEGENYDTVWADFDSVASILSFENDRAVVQAAIAATGIASS